MADLLLCGPGERTRRTPSTTARTRVVPPPGLLAPALVGLVCLVVVGMPAPLIDPAPSPAVVVRCHDLLPQLDAASASGGLRAADARLCAPRPVLSRPTPSGALVPSR